MLKTLRKLSPEDRIRVLGASLDTLLPRSPFSDHPIVPDLVQSLIRDAREDKNLGGDDHSPLAQWLLLESLAKELTDQISDAKKLREARERLGSRGLLPYQRYELRFVANFDQVVAPRGVTRERVEQAVRSPKGIEHLPAMAGDETAPSNSLILGHKGESGLSVLVEVSRDRDRLTAGSAWLFSDDDLPSPETPTPLAYLKAFLSVFGQPLVLDSRPPSLVVVHEVIPLDSFGLTTEEAASAVGRSDHSPFFSSPVGDPGDEFYTKARLRVSPLGFLEVQMLYCVSLTSYRRALQRRGVNIGAFGRT